MRDRVAKLCVVWCSILATCSYATITTMPPLFESQGDQPEKQIAYKIGERVVLPCRASGEPKPHYAWFKDGRPLDITGLRILRQPGAGTIIINDPKKQHEGVYQCKATNEFGTAVSLPAMLKYAVLDHFPTVKQPTIHRPEVGDSLSLYCDPPYSYPDGMVYWALVKKGTKFKAITESARIALDYEGNLHIANIVVGDDHGGLHYVCARHNEKLRSLVQGEDQLIYPDKTSGNLHFANVQLNDTNRGSYTYLCMEQNPVLRNIAQGADQDVKPTQSQATPQYRAPKLMWHSESPTVALEGHEKAMKCIFSGFPTPEVKWTRIQGSLSSRARMESHGQELKFDRIERSDEGRYRCSATNAKDGAAVHNDFHLRVESAPSWSEEPESVSTSEEESAAFYCKVNGRPKPTVEWSINGRPEREFPPDSRRTVIQGNIFFKNVTKTDSQVLQCKASNKHGYIFTNVYLNVLTVPPTFRRSPESVLKTAVGSVATFTCEVFGAPKPRITWKKDGAHGDPVELPDSGKYKTLKNDSLVIYDLDKDDAGTYICEAKNKFGEAKESGSLVVRDKTEILTPPSNKELMAGESTTFYCNAKTDAAETTNLKITWYKDGVAVNFKDEPRLQMNMQDYSLTVTSAQAQDSGVFRCVADNGIDSATLDANLIVRDKPDPPQNLVVDTCGQRFAEISWTPGDDNNDPIIEYIAFYNTSFDEGNAFHEVEKRIPAHTMRAKIELTPWANYTFHVRARNSLGVSKKSRFTGAYCKTPPTFPYKNPANVCSVSREPTNLVITWTPMPKYDHNGEDFHYVVSYRLKGHDRAHEKFVYDWQQSEITIKNQEVFREYVIYVQAANNRGRSPDRTVKSFKGYSGQDAPLDSPAGFRIKSGTLNATSAVFLWDPVPNNPDRIRGHFKGYQVLSFHHFTPSDVIPPKVRYWKADDKDAVKTHDVIAGTYDPCPPVNSVTRFRRQSIGTQAHVFDLWPYSEVKAAVLVMNGGKSGPLSDEISFRTPQGFPGKVRKINVYESGSHHLRVTWEEPLYKNGIIEGYRVGYQAVKPPGQLVRLEGLAPVERRYQILSLSPDTLYHVFIWAKTQPGEGAPAMAEATTRPLSRPDVPGIDQIHKGDDYLNVSWVPTEKGTPKNNPGQDFYVEYRLSEHDAQYQKVFPADNNNWVNVSNLEYNEVYDVRVVAKNGIGEETPSAVRPVRVGPDSEPVVQKLATAGWFVGLIIAIIFLLLILVILCLVRRNRGGKYPVYEKEKLRGRGMEEDDDPGFGEYTRHAPPPQYKKSAGSINSDEKPLESDTDSMAEYEDTDPSKFNEDGSFIGQYGGKSSKEAAKTADATSPSALSTFV